MTSLLLIVVVSKGILICMFVSTKYYLDLGAVLVSTSTEAYVLHPMVVFRILTRPGLFVHYFKGKSPGEGDQMLTDIMEVGSHPGGYYKKLFRFICVEGSYAVGAMLWAVFTEEALSSFLAACSVLQMVVDISRVYHRQFKEDLAISDRKFLDA